MIREGAGHVKEVVATGEARPVQLLQDLRLEQGGGEVLDPGLSKLNKELDWKISNIYIYVLLFLPG